MKVFKELGENFGLSIGLGFFDGVHVAHQKIIEKTVQLARENGLKSAIITFIESPIECLHPEKKQKYLTSNPKKIELIEALGIDFLYLIDFNSIKMLSAYDYMSEVLYKNFRPKFITTGFNNHFGKGRTGNAHVLEEFADEFGYTYFQIPPQKMDGVLISSTKIKSFIKAGDLASAKMFLGRNFEVEGTVIEGNKLGREIGFPTANLVWQENIIKLPHAVYRGYSNIEGKKHPALINWGARPTVDSKEILEAHLLNFDQDIYGKKISVEFVEKIREQAKFENIEQLKAQLHKDTLL